MDIKICSQDDWSKVLKGDGMQDQVVLEVLADLLEKEEEEVSETKEAELKLLAANKTEYWWHMHDGSAIWKKVCEVHRAEQEMVDDEITIVVFGDVLELDQIEEELRAERNLDLEKEHTI